MAQTLEHNQSITQVTPLNVPSCDVDVTVIQQLDDEPNDVGGLTAAELKAKFDETSKELKDYINQDLIPAIIAADATEQARAAAEAERVANETERVSNESSRVSAETTRGSNETTRQSNETTRQSNEADRVTAEAAREAAETGYVAQCAASASSASNSASTAGTKAQDSEAWSVGQRGGTDVPSTDPTYHNNAKYWAEQASQAAGGGVTSFNGRSGTVVPLSGDYTAEMVGAYEKPSGGIPDSDIASAATWNGKQSQHSSTTATLTTAGWSNSAQTVNVTGVTASNSVIVAPAPASATAYGDAGIICTTQASGTLTFTCESTPTSNITVNVLILD